MTFLEALRAKEAECQRKSALKRQRSLLEHEESFLLKEDKQEQISRSHSEFERPEMDDSQRQESMSSAFSDELYKEEKIHKQQIKFEDYK